MGVYSGEILSGSTNGKPIPVAATTTPGTVIHTAQAGTSGYDEVYLFAANVSAGTVTLTVEWGGVTDPGDHLIKGYSIPGNSPQYPIAVGQRVNNSVVIRAFGGSASAINITGWVNRKTA
jgi:hypothetical protein